MAYVSRRLAYSDMDSEMCCLTTARSSIETLYVASRFKTSRSYGFAAVLRVTDTFVYVRIV